MPPEKKKPVTLKDVMFSPENIYLRNPSVEKVVKGLGCNSSVQKIFSSIPVSGDDFYNSVLHELKCKAFSIALVLRDTLGDERVPWYGGLSSALRDWHKINLSVKSYKKLVPLHLCMDVVLKSCENVCPSKGTLQEHWSAVLQDRYATDLTDVWDYPEQERIVLLCRRLQLVGGDKPFYLKHDYLANLLNCSREFVSSQLRILAGLGFIYRVSSGHQGRCSTYYFIAEENPDRFKVQREIVRKLIKEKGKKYAT